MIQSRRYLSRREGWKGKMNWNVQVLAIEDTSVTIGWDKFPEAETYRVYWADKDTQTMQYKMLGEVSEASFTLKKATHVPHYFKVAAVRNGEEIAIFPVLKTACKKVFHEQLEKLSRGLVAVKTEQGVFLSWRLMLDEVSGYGETGLTGADFMVFKNGKPIAFVTDSTNYMDASGTGDDEYQVAPIWENEGDGKDILEEFDAAGLSAPVRAFAGGKNYFEIPMKQPAPGVTPKGEHFFYEVNDISVGDVDGDGEYEYFVKWNASNAKDVSQKGYTGNCLIDCYKADGTILWRLDLGCNIRAGAHYTQFMVYDFDGDGRAEMSVKTAPGTKMLTFDASGEVCEEHYITMLQEDTEAGYSHTDDYRCSAQDYYEYLVELFCGWQEHEMVKKGIWPSTLEECFDREKTYEYPLSREDAKELADYFLDVYAPSRSEKNKLREFEGFVFRGPEYLSMFSGDGRELQTIRFQYGREDDGLLWGDYALPRIEPCNRVDRFLSGVAYLDGEHPYLIVCRGYYTRSTLVAYSFRNGKFEEYWSVDSGWVLMDNPFCYGAHEAAGCDPVYGRLAGQGNHSLSTADVDGDGCQEIIYGAAVIDHDGSLLYSSYGYLPDGKTFAKFGHGDAMHVADINPDKPGLEIFNVFEGAKAAPYGYALRDAETGEVIYGEYAERDLGRCMIGDVVPGVRGLQTWCTKVRDALGRELPVKPLGTNQKINWAADLSTQVLDGADIFGGHKGVINDMKHGVMLLPEGTATNNGTKGNPCLVADLFGDWREELVLRTEDNSAIRIYTNTELTGHKLFTLMHDVMYRTGVAWQNNCYNQPCYTKFYLASDMEWKYVLPFTDFS